jgi:hypothetical protein
MFTCQDFAEHLFEFVEEGLPPGRRRQVAEHLAFCPHCSGDLRGYRRVIQLGCRLHDVLPPTHLFRRFCKASAERGPV